MTKPDSNRLPQQLLYGFAIFGVNVSWYRLVRSTNSTIKHRRDSGSEYTYWMAEQVAGIIR